MNPKNIQLTDSALKELTTNLDGSPVEETEEYIKNSKNEILSNITKSINHLFRRDEKFSNKDQKHSWRVEIKPFEIESIKVDVSKDNEWIDLSILKLLENNEKFLFISIPYIINSGRVVAIKGSHFELNDVSFNEIFKLQGTTQYIVDKTIKYLQEVTKENLILKDLDKQERDIFKGIF